jgi:hypothetical protein
MRRERMAMAPADRILLCAACDGARRMKAAERRIAGIAAIGTDGVLSYVVTERRREIGIRIALGARPEMVLGSVVQYGLKLTSVGVAAGLVGALGLTRLLDTLLFGIQPSDPVTFFSVAIAITVVAVAASVVPAYRAIRVDPYHGFTTRVASTGGDAWTASRTSNATHRPMRLSTHHLPPTIETSYRLPPTTYRLRSTI